MHIVPEQENRNSLASMKTQRDNSMKFIRNQEDWKTKNYMVKQRDCLDKKELQSLLKATHNKTEWRRKGHGVADSLRKAGQGTQSTTLEIYHLSRCLEVIHLKLVGLCAERIQSVLLGCFFKAVSFLRLRTLLQSMTEIRIRSKFSDHIDFPNYSKKVKNSCNQYSLWHQYQ